MMTEEEVQILFKTAQSEWFHYLHALWALEISVEYRRGLYDK